MKNTKTWLLVALVSTFVAMAAHGYLSLQSYGLKSGTLAEKSVCNINSQFNCDAVALSDYATFLGVPIAMWGLATNALLVIFLGVGAANMSVNRARVFKGALIVAGLILAATLVMGSISVVQLGTYCLICIGTYALSAAQFFATLKLQEEPFFANLKETVSGILNSQRWIAGVFLLVPAGAYLGHSMASDAYGLKSADRYVAESLSFWRNAPVNDFNTDLGLKSHAAENPKMVIVEFADYLCPHCRVAATPLHTFTESRKDVQLIFKPFPLDGTCNPAIAQKGDGLRCELAAATLCAEKLVHKGWQAHDAIFANQNEMNSASWREGFEAFSQSLGADPKALRECLDSPDIKDQVAKMADEGGKANIPGTPTIFVNGKKLDRGQMIPTLEAVYKAL